jgi:hypothetical protein
MSNATSWASIPDGANKVPGIGDTMVFDPTRSAGGQQGSNASPSDSLPGNEYGGLVMAPQYQGTIYAGGNLLFDGDVTIEGGKLIGLANKQLQVGYAGAAAALTFGSGFPGAAPELDMPVFLRPPDPDTGNPVTMNIQGPGKIDATVTNHGQVNVLPGA